MKKNDIVLIMVVVFISGAFTLVLTGLLVNPEKQKLSVEVVEPITAEFNEPTPEDLYFNAQAINPTQQIQIGNGTNNQPPTN